MTFTAQELREMADGCVAKSQAIISHWHDCQPTSERRNKEVMADVTPLVTQSRMLRYAATLVERQVWNLIESAPKGSWLTGPKLVNDPAYVKPPKLWLCLEDGRQCVGYADAYYAEGGSAYDGEPPWVEEFSGERINPTHWKPLDHSPAHPRGDA